MRRRIAALFLALCVLDAGCQTCLAPACAAGNWTPPIEGATAGGASFRQWARDHPFAFGGLAVATAAGAAFLAGYLVYQEAKSGKAITPLPFPQVGQ